LEEALASYDRAIQIKPDSHYAWLNRGVAAGKSHHYNPESAILLRVQFPTLPPILPDPTLTQRGYEGALLSYETGLKHCPQETHPEGWGKLHQSIGNAHYFQGKEKRNYREYWHKAVAEYKLSLITLTPEAYPELHLEVLQDLSRVLWGLGKETEAKEWRRKGLDVFGTLLNRPMSRYQQWELRAKFITFSQMRVDVLVEEGDLIRALEAAERDKNFYLTWILDRQKADSLSPNYQDMLELTNPTTAIVYWHVSDFALTTFIIKHGARKPIVIQPLPSSPRLGEGARESFSNSSFPMAESGVGAKHLGEMLSEKPEDDNPNASPWINAVGDNLSEKPEDNNLNASPWINAVGDNLSEKPEDDNPNASPWINAVGDNLSEKPEDDNPNASPWINAVGDNLQTESGQGEAFADKNPDLPDNLQTESEQGEAFADKNPDLPDNLLAQMLHPYSEISNGDNLRELQAWVDNWDEVYGKSANQKKERDISFQDNLPKMLAKLENILYIPAILEQLKAELIENLIFIPHRDLHRFPLHALFPDRFVISYLPSVQMGINLSGGSLAADGLSVGSDVGGSLAADGLSVGSNISEKIANSSVTSVTTS
ncbi:tetratricopeptide repeat protein, partial [Symplocastrum sp. BBK-W-15]|nr:tetratricopeptide repeat protein [Limnofasciculus baicalensis BBK-W-15]